MISRELPVINHNNNLWPKGWRKRPCIMGVVNVTPDSFSDGGFFYDLNDALKRAKQCVYAGADVIDFGGQSTRPGATIIHPEEEIERVIPVLKLVRKELPESILSIDTYYSKVAKLALETGANWVNDISGGRLDPLILDVIAEYKAPFVITHSRGNSKTMDDLSSYNNVLEDVYDELMRSIDIAISKGINHDQIIIDPGLGFAKNNDQNLRILSGLENFTRTDFPVLVGPSRKKFIGYITKKNNPKDRVFGTAAVVCRCVQSKVDIVRVHDIAEIKQTIDMANTLWPK